MQVEADPKTILELLYCNQNITEHINDPDIFTGSAPRRVIHNVAIVIYGEAVVEQLSLEQEAQCEGPYC